MENENQHSELANKVSLPAILGFKEPLGISRQDLSNLQISINNIASPLKNIMSLIGGGAAAFIMMEVTAMPIWIGWLVLFTVFQASIIIKSKAINDRKIGSDKASHVKNLILLSTISGVLWGLPFVLLAIYGTTLSLIYYCAVALILVIISPQVLPLIPAATLLFQLAIATLGALSFTLLGEYDIAGFIVGVTALLFISTLRNAHSSILYELSSTVLQEKSETVSLLLREFEDSGADWLWQTDTSRCAIHVSPRFAYALGVTPNEANGQPLLKLIAGDAWETGKYPTSLHDLAERLKRREPFSNLILPVEINGSMKWWELSASARTSDSGAFLGFRGVGSDVTEQRESEQKISKLARYDTLTSLPNRLQLTEALDESLRDADKWRRRCAFFMIDLDRFKAVNDTLGHPVGDRLLAQVSKRLGYLMTDNELCGRLGGDEFAIVIKDATDSAYIDRLAKSIIEAIAKPFEIDQHTIFIGASIGSARGPVDGRTVEMLMRSADLALYRSKDEGGNSHFAYHHQLLANAEQRRTMEIELRKALERNELHVEYQPVVSASSEHTLNGFEALVRWNNAKLGSVSPFKFISVAEDARLIVPIGNWVLRQACRDAVQWPGNTKVAVNISVDQLNSTGFVQSVSDALKDSGLPAWRLELEVTEGIFLRDGGAATQILNQIREMGIKLSLDDFGTGYSSLGYLRNNRFDTIKIDRSFVTGAAQNKAESLAIIRAVVALCESLGLATTAEGVETEHELQMIQQLGCTKIQGYYFGRPMVFDDSMLLFENGMRAEKSNVA